MGRGTRMALILPWILAGELPTHDNLRAALASRDEAIPLYEEGSGCSDLEPGGASPANPAEQLIAIMRSVLLRINGAPPLARPKARTSVES